MLKEQIEFFGFNFLSKNPTHITGYWNTSSEYLSKNFRSPKGFYKHDISTLYLFNNETLIEALLSENIMFLVLSILIYMYTKAKG